MPKAIQPVHDKLKKVRTAAMRMSAHSKAMFIRWLRTRSDFPLVAKELRPLERKLTAIVDCMLGLLRLCSSVPATYQLCEALRRDPTLMGVPQPPQFHILRHMDTMSPCSSIKMNRCTFTQSTLRVIFLKSKNQSRGSFKSPFGVTKEMSYHEIVASLPHKLRVMRMYRYGLRELLNYSANRQHWYPRAFALRAEFEANRAEVSSRESVLSLSSCCWYSGTASDEHIALRRCTNACLVALTSLALICRLAERKSGKRWSMERHCSRGSSIGSHYSVSAVCRMSGTAPAWAPLVRRSHMML